MNRTSSSFAVPQHMAYSPPLRRALSSVSALSPSNQLENDQELLSSVTAAKKSFKKMKKQKKEAVALLKAQEEAHSRLQNKYDRTKGKLRACEEENVKLSTEVAKARKQKRILADLVEEVQTKLDNQLYIGDSLSEDRKKIGEDRKLLLIELKQLELKVEERDREIHSIQSAYDKLLAEHQVLQSTAEQRRATVASAHSDCRQLSAKVNAQEAQIATLNGQLRLAKQEKEDLESVKIELSKYKGSSGLHTAAMREASERVKELKQKKKSLQEKCERFREDRDGLSSKNMLLEQENVSLKEKVAQLQSDLSKSDASVAALQHQVAQQQSMFFDWQKRHSEEQFLTDFGLQSPTQSPSRPTMPSFFPSPPFER